MPQHPTAPASRLQVLVVEDEALVRLMLADELREQGFEVFEAVDADEALKTALIRIQREQAEALVSSRPDWPIRATWRYQARHGIQLGHIRRLRKNLAAQSWAISPSVARWGPADGGHVRK